MDINIEPFKSLAPKREVKKQLKPVVNKKLQQKKDSLMMAEINKNKKN